MSILSRQAQFGWAALAIGTVVGAFFALKESASGANKELEGTKKEGEAAAKALGDTKKESDAAEKALKNLADNGAKEATEAGKKLEETYSKAEKAIKRTAEALAKIREAEQKLEIAKIDAAEQSGKLSPEAAAAARFAAGKSHAGANLSADQKLAAALSANEDAKVAAAKRNVQDSTDRGFLLAKDQDQLFGEKAEVAGKISSVQDEAREAAAKSDDKIAAARKAREAYTTRAGKDVDHARIRRLDDAVSAAEAEKAKTQHEIAGKITPLAKQRDEIDERLAKYSESLATANAELVAFTETLKKVSAEAAEKKHDIKQDITTETEVAKIDAKRTDLKKPGVAKKTNAAAASTPEEKSLSVGEAHEAVLSDLSAAFGSHSEAAAGHLQRASDHVRKITTAAESLARGAEKDAKRIQLLDQRMRNARETGP